MFPTNRLLNIQKHKKNKIIFENTEIEWMSNRYNKKNYDFLTLTRKKVLKNPESTT